MAANDYPTLGAKYKNVGYSIPNAYKIQVSVIPNSLQLLDNTSTAISPITSVYRDFISLQAFTEREFYNNFDGVYGSRPSYTHRVAVFQLHPVLVILASLLLIGCQFH